LPTTGNMSAFAEEPRTDPVDLAAMTKVGREA
jgi:hypothetical protein